MTASLIKKLETAAFDDVEAAEDRRILKLEDAIAIVRQHEAEQPEMSRPDLHKLVVGCVPLEIKPQLAWAIADNFLEALAALLALKPQPAAGWQPIETAPKGQKILAYSLDRFDRKTPDIQVTFWNEGRWAWFSSHSQPVAWMPLPTPPEGEQP